MSVDEQEEAGVESVEDTEMKDGSTKEVKSVERGGSAKPKATIKKSKGKASGKISSHSSEGDKRDQKPTR
jgi:hypothetical protein